MVARILGILGPEVCRVRMVCGEPGAWWRGMNRKKSKAEQPNYMAFHIFMLSFSLHMHNTVPMGHTNNSKIVSNIIKALPTYHWGKFWGTQWDLDGHTLGTKKPSQKSNNTHPPQKKNLGLLSVFFFFFPILFFCSSNCR